jgi:predicted metal-dependent hydrolase
MKKDNFSLCYRNVKYPRIEVKSDGVKLIVPKNYSLKIDEIVKRYEDWIEKKNRALKELAELSQRLTLFNNEDFKELIYNYVKEYSELLKIKPEKISFRKMKKGWASCNVTKRKLIFNKELRFLPKEIIKYVVFHELCHLLVSNHKKEFWQLVEKFQPDFKEKEKILASYRLLLTFVKEKNKIL